MQDKSHKRRGVAIIFAVAVMAVIFFVALGAVNYLNRQIVLSRNITQSAPAYYAAESGIECLLHKRFILGETPASDCIDSLPNNADFNASDDGSVLSAHGFSGNATRSIKLYLGPPGP